MAANAAYGDQLSHAETGQGLTTWFRFAAGWIHPDVPRAKWMRSLSISRFKPARYAQHLNALGRCDGGGATTLLILAPVRRRPGLRVLWISHTYLYAIHESKDLLSDHSASFRVAVSVGHLTIKRGWPLN
jgi:hypothetical protein